MIKFSKKKDLIIIVSILLIAVLLYFTYKIYLQEINKNGSKAEIYYESELIMSVDLNEKIDKTFSLLQNENVVFHLYEDGSISFEKSDCPDKVCINSGRLKHVGSSTACLPNKIILKIISVNPNESDADMIVK